MSASVAFREMTFRRNLNFNLVFERFSFEFDRFPVAVLGPNGAGKSTLFELAAGVLRPNSGGVFVNSVPTSTMRGRQHARRTVGLVAQNGTGLAGLNVREALAYAGWLKGVSRSEAWARSEDLLSRVNLGGMAARPSTSLSGGQMRRLAIAQGLIGEPAVLLLDEATAGLDPAERKNIVEIVLSIAPARAVIASTHEVDDIADIFEYVCVLDHGDVAFSGTIDEFLALSSLRVGGDVSSRDRAEDAYATCLKPLTE